MNQGEKKKTRLYKILFFRNYFGLKRRSVSLISRDTLCIDDKPLSDQ